MNAEEFFAAPETREPSRPKAVNPLTGKEQSWTRASNYAASLDSPHGLVVWQLRELVRGLALRPDLARMILAGVPLDDDSATAKTKIDEIIKGAHGTAAIDAKANDGTAIHAALSRSWVHGIASVAEEFHKYVHAFAAACKEYGLRPVATEQTVLNTKRGSRGTFDWLMQEADGSHVIVDVKSGRLDVAKRKFDVQCAIYDEADFVLHEDGSASPIPWNLRRPYAVLVHIDPETAAVSVYKLDLHIGRYGAELAEKVRQWHTFDPMTPYSPPFTTTMGRVNPAPVPNETIIPAPVAHLQPPITGDGSGTALPEVGGAGVPFEPTETPASPLDSSTTPTVSSSASAPTASPSEVVGTIEVTEPRPASAAEALAAPEKPYDPEARFALLMKSMEKAELQMELKKRGWTDLSHNRRWLARALIVLEQGWTDEKMIRKYAAAKDDAGGAASPMSVAEAARAVAVADADRYSTRRDTAVAAIIGAKSVGALAAFHSDFVQRHGDAAWTDELAEAAKARTAELDNVDTVATLARIELCDEQSDLAELWSEITLGGSVKSLWAPFEKAAQLRMGVIRDRAMQQKTDNPFG